jgi:GDP-D-mannose dehydratase
MKTALITGVTGQDGSHLAEPQVGWPSMLTHDLSRRRAEH